MACSTGCPTPGAHPNWGACIQAKHLQFPDIEAHAANQSIYTASDMYRDARADGLQPETVTVDAVMRARHVTDATGVLFRADQPYNGQLPEVE